MNKLSALKPYLTENYIYRIISDKQNHPFLEKGDLAIFCGVELDETIGKMTLVIDSDYELIGILSRFKEKLSLHQLNSEKITLDTDRPKFYTLNQVIK